MFNLKSSLLLGSLAGLTASSLMSCSVNKDIDSSLNEPQQVYVELRTFDVSQSNFYRPASDALGKLLTK